MEKLKVRQLQARVVRLEREAAARERALEGRGMEVRELAAKLQMLEEKENRDPQRGERWAHVSHVYSS